MGTWTIIISGAGCHHNGDRAEEVKDADWMARNFVKELAKNHVIYSAEFMLGSCENLVQKKVENIIENDNLLSFPNDTSSPIR